MIGTVATAGISYIFNDLQSESKSEIVTASSTIIDPQGIRKYVIYPPMRFAHPSPPSMVSAQQNEMISMRRKCQSNLFRIPIDQQEQINEWKREFSMVFFWSIPLKANLIQTPTNSAVIVENSNAFQYYSMKISIGTQSVRNDRFCPLQSSDYSRDSMKIFHRKLLFPIPMRH